jgi:N-acetylglucosaminyldiphosphoundecaprenol N-acetyl-beta-D-mannosaminyltransferase
VRTHVLGVPLDDVTDDALARTLDGFLASPNPHLVVTPNAEFIMTARHDETFRAILRRADLAPPDGIGPVFAARWLVGRRIRRVPGPELLERVFTAAEKRGSRVFLYGGKPGVAREAARTIAVHHPQLAIVGAESGFRGWGWRLYRHDLVRRVRTARPEVLVVALGAPRQEKWIAHHLWGLPSVRLAIGVGGALDFLAGRVRRAPAAMRRAGLEWLWRLAVEPWRLPRILTATVRFSWVAFWSKLIPRMNPAW